jgi:two-component system sensor histidine kinase BaeS
LTNARRYTDPGGRVRVSLEQTPGETVLAVADTGIGIAPEHLAQVFDRFWRAPDARRRAAEGTGVGLALVRDLVRAHHGRVEVFSSPGCGSRFVVLLPTAPRARAAGLGRRPRADRLTAGAADRPAARRAPA